MRRPQTILAAALLSFGLVSCAGNEDTSQPSSPSTVTVTESPTATSTKTPVETEPDSPEPPPPAPQPDCGISPSSDAITAPIPSLAPPSAPNTAWVYEGESNFDPCAELSYALLAQQPQGNSQFETKILFFHKGEYLGFDSTYPQQAMEIQDKGNRLVVTYKDWEALAEVGGSNAEAPNYTATVTFFWDATSGQLGTEGTFPNQGLSAQ